ncbi:MAG: YbaB/EbfC family nucleoid-associated protein [Planctomycetes bacterium]|nr:YbaB/EbfC family nucleoid-associated protein [Planctomycetota bacterium]
MGQGFGSGAGELGSLLKQAQEMQKRAQEIERELGERIVEGSAGGGAVRCYVTGRLDVQAIKIDRDAVDPEDVEGLEDLVTVAVRQAVQSARQLKEREMAKLTGGINMPGFGF